MLKGGGGDHDLIMLGVRPQKFELNYFRHKKYFSIPEICFCTRKIAWYHCETHAAQTNITAQHAKRLLCKARKKLTF